MYVSINMIEKKNAVTYFYFASYQAIELSNRLENLEMVQQASAASFNQSNWHLSSSTNNYCHLCNVCDDNNWHMK